MASSNSIYYPSIEVRDTGWLRTACLYWDSVYTIVPRTFDAPYNDRDCQSLEAEGILRPYFVSPDLEIVNDIADDFIAYLDTPEAKKILLGGSGRMDYIHPDKIPSSLKSLSSISLEKISYKIQDLFRKATSTHRGQKGWLLMDEQIANYYMTLLASRISDQIGASVVTDETDADSLGLVVKAGSKLPNPIGFTKDARRWPRASHRDVSMPVSFAEGALATLALDGIGLDPEIPVEELIKFRNRYPAELGRFRSAIAHLASGVKDDMPLEAMRQKKNLGYLY